MGARQKLNGAAVNGCCLVAAAVGLAAQSWWVFLLALAAAGWAVYNRDIRPGGTRW